MIAPLRAWHRRITVLLAILLPLLILLAYVFRVPELPENELPAALAGERSSVEAER
jgi:hypothetical protein